MAVPSAPTNLATAAVVSETWVDANTTWALWMRDNRPVFKGQASNKSVASGTAWEFGFGTVSATFANVANTNVGAFTVASVANGDGVYNLEVPEAGIYEGIWNVGVTADAAGDRRARPQKNSVNIAGVEVQIPPPQGAALTSYFSVPFQIDCTAAGDELSLEIWQNSGSALTTECYLSVKWIQST